MQTDAELHQRINKWLPTGDMAKLYEFVLEGFIHVRSHEWLCRLDIIQGFEACRAEVEVISGVLESAAASTGSWGLFIDRMLQVADPLLHNHTATLAMRLEDWRAPDLVLQISNISHSIVRDAAAGQFPMESFRPLAKTLTTPVSFVIPGTKSPLDNRARFEATKPVQAQGAISATKDQRAPLPAILPIGGVMPIWKIAAMSSAAGGFLASTVTAVTAIKSLFGTMFSKGPPAAPSLTTEERAALDKFRAHVNEFKEFVSGAATSTGTTRADASLIAAAGASPCQTAIHFCESLTPSQITEFYKCFIDLTTECGTAALSYLGTCCFQGAQRVWLRPR